MNDNNKLLERCKRLTHTKHRLQRNLALVSLYGMFMTILCIVLVICIASTEPKVTVAEAIEIEPSQAEVLVSEEYVATAYCACKKCCGKTDGITKTGTIATEGRTIAVDPKKIPLGSKVIIDGHEYIAEDIGGAIKGNRVDIYFDSHSDALEFGRKTVNLMVIGDE